MNETKSFGQWLRHRRREIDLTQEEMARLVSCAPITIRKIEADQMRPSKQLAELLMGQLGVPANERVNLMPFARGGEITQSRSKKIPCDNLPHPVSSFIGREREITEIDSLIQGSRLVTLTGAGGCGKTRLAIEVAGRMSDLFPDGIWFAAFAPLFDPQLVQRTIASVLGVREDPSRPLIKALCDYLYSKHQLLVFDNCEHLIEECAQVADALLQACPALRILATSREALGIEGEEQYYVPCLSLPEAGAEASIEKLCQSEAVRLFVNRGALVQSTFSLTAENSSPISQICQRLDGMPLAIELAAARVKVLTVQHILQELDDRFNMLTSGNRTVLPRHRTLRAAIEWSYELLPENTRTLFRRLSVFAGGFTQEAAQSVCSDNSPGAGEFLDELSRLVNRSLVEVLQSGDIERYRMLEPIRWYARERLNESCEERQMRDRHLGFFMDWTEKTEPKLRGPEQIVWRNRIETEYDNIRTALEWSLSGGDTHFGLRLAVAEHRFWYESGFWKEGLKWLRALLSGIPDMAWTPERAKALVAAGTLAMDLSPTEALDVRYERSLEYLRGVGDNWWSAYALAGLAWHFLYTCDASSAQESFKDAVAFAYRSEDNWMLGYTLRGLGAAIERIDYSAAQPILEESLAYSRASGDRWAVAAALNQLGTVALGQSDYPRAVALFDEAVRVWREVQDRIMISNGIAGPVYAMLGMGDTLRATEFEREYLLLAQDMGFRPFLAYAVMGFGYIAGVESRPRRSITLLAAGEALLNAIGITYTMYPWWLTLYERCMANAHAILDESEFSMATEKGRSMTLEQAIEFALETTQE